METRINRRSLLATASAVVLSGGGIVGSTGMARAASTKTIHYLSGQNDQTGYSKIINERSLAYAKQHPDIKWQFEYIGDTGDLQGRIQQLVAAGNLPTLFGNPANQILEDLNAKGKLVDVEAVFKQMGIWDQLNPAIVKLLQDKEKNPNGLYELPLELNIEGFWYNKKMFADNELTVPKTWDELLAAAAKLSAKGIQPFSASGQQGWPLTRLIGGYAERVYGPDAMSRVASGDLKLTDDGFVNGAQIVKDMAGKDYFGKGVTTIVYDTAVDLFLQGKAALFYMGSWELRDFNDPKRNKIGVDNIGFFNIPLVTGGKGTLDDWSENAGLTVVVNKDQYDATLADWMKYVFNGFGDAAMKEQGAISGFEVSAMPAGVSSITQSTLETIKGVKTGFLWFEALFNAKANSLSTTNVQTLVTDAKYSAKQYMSDLQDALDAK